MTLEQMRERLEEVRESISDRLLELDCMWWDAKTIHNKAFKRLTAEEYELMKKIDQHVNGDRQ